MLSHVRGALKKIPILQSARMTFLTVEQPLGCPYYWLIGAHELPEVHRQAGQVVIDQGQEGEQGGGVAHQLLRLVPLGQLGEGARAHSLQGQGLLVHHLCM